MFLHLPFCPDSKQNREQLKAQHSSVLEQTSVPEHDVIGRCPSTNRVHCWMQVFLLHACTETKGWLYCEITILNKHSCHLSSKLQYVKAVKTKGLCAPTAEWQMNQWLELQLKHSHWHFQTKTSLHNYFSHACMFLTSLSPNRSSKSSLCLSMAVNFSFKLETSAISSSFWVSRADRHKSS